MDRKSQSVTKFNTTTKSLQSTGGLGTSGISGQDGEKPQKKQLLDPKNLYHKGITKQPEKEKCYEEELLEREIYPIERVNLDRVFQMLSEATPKLEQKREEDRPRDGKLDDEKSNPSQYDKKFGETNRFSKAKLKEKPFVPHINADDIAKILEDLNFKMSRSEIENMIWVRQSITYFITLVGSRRRPRWKDRQARV